jgi:hypothetical protein
VLLARLPETERLVIHFDARVGAAGLVDHLINLLVFFRIPLRATAVGSVAPGKQVSVAGVHFCYQVVLDFEFLCHHQIRFVVLLFLIDRVVPMFLALFDCALAWAALEDGALEADAEAGKDVSKHMRTPKNLYCEA